jgi:hypothetical protein
LLYVGISLSAVDRLSKHRIRSSWFRQIASITIEWFGTRVEAIAAEQKAIESESHRFNVVHSGRLPDSILRQIENSPCARERMLKQDIAARLSCLLGLPRPSARA